MSPSNTPMLFHITSQLNLTKSVYAGVLEFIAEEGRVYLPSWVIPFLILDDEQLGLRDSDLVQIKRQDYLPKGTFIKIQPLSLDFLDITDPKAVLENSLRNFTALKEGDEISISYNNQTFDLLIMETKPRPEGISIHETDLEVDFAPPPGYKEPQKQEKSLVNGIFLH